MHRDGASWMNTVGLVADDVDDIRRRLDELGQRQAELDRSQAALVAEMAEAIARARAAGIYGREIAKLTRLTRSWLYRRFRTQMNVGD